MSNLYIEETWIEERDDDTRYLIGESGIYESYFDKDETIGNIVNDLKKSYGKIRSKMYREIPVWNHYGYVESHITEHIGYVFEKKDYYEDTKEPFIRETWVTLYNSKNPKDIKVIGIENNSLT